MLHYDGSLPLIDRSPPTSSILMNLSFDGSGDGYVVGFSPNVLHGAYFVIVVGYGANSGAFTLAATCP